MAGVRNRMNYNSLAAVAVNYNAKGAVLNSVQETKGTKTMKPVPLLMGSWARDRGLELPDLFPVESVWSVRNGRDGRYARDNLSIECNDKTREKNISKPKYTAASLSFYNGHRRHLVQQNFHPDYTALH
ncbi:hypothetical protein NC651_039481 [Populus alba x Populus x berolinensis]|nr:hypothetical protein NC651_039481 [Populus alba x Populus x berolinensis]